MGFAITWCAVREEKAEQFLQELGLTPTGQTEEFPDSLIASARFNTGWRVLWYNKYGCPFLRPKDLERLSLEREVILCLVEEHVMASSCEFWSGGKQKWRLSHEGEGGPKGLLVEGEPPANFPAIRGEMEQKQLVAGGDKADVDYIFEIPLKVAESIVGFKHDEGCDELTDGCFAVLTQPASKKGWLQRLLGG